MNSTYFENITIDGLIDFFRTQQKESNFLEFKSGETDFQKLYKEVCAFANTDGGIIIYGAPIELETKDDKGKKIKVCYGELKYTKEDREEDSIIQSIISNISPSPTGIKVKKISSDNGRVYIIFIEKSKKPPHQVNGTYYMRAGTMSIPAPHGFVEALMNQRMPIQLRINVQVNPYIDAFKETKNGYKISVSVTNDSYYPAKEIEMYVGILGKVFEYKHSKEDNDFKMSLVNNGIKCLYNLFSSDQTIVSHLWYTRNFFITSLNDEFEVQLIVWSKDCPATGLLIKYNKTDGTKEYDLYEEGEVQESFYKRLRGEE